MKIFANKENPSPPPSKTGSFPPDEIATLDFVCMNNLSVSFSVSSMSTILISRVRDPEKQESAITRTFVILNPSNFLVTYVKTL